MKGGDQMTILPVAGRARDVSGTRAPAQLARRRAWRLQRSERIAGFLFVTPISVLFVLFVGWPIIRAIYLSLTRWSGFGSPQFTGVANYTRMVQDPVAGTAFRNTIFFAVLSTVLQTVVPLIIAVLLNTVWRGLSVVLRTLLFVPGIVGFVVSGVLWKLIYDPNLGTLNTTLARIGAASLQHRWLSDPRLVMWSLLVVSLWGAVGMNMLIFFAGIQGVDHTLYEAAQVDGATAWAQFRYVTIPSLRIVTAIVISLNLMNGFKVFDLVYVMTAGGPNHASEVFGTYLYSLAFGSTAGSIPQLGYGSAFSVIVMALCSVAVLVQMLLTRMARR